MSIFEAVYNSSIHNTAYPFPSSTAMREILSAQHGGIDMMSMSFSAVGAQSSPFRNTGTFSTFTPAASMSRTHDSFTPQRSSSPVQQTAKKSKLAISTSSLRLGSSMSRSASGIALASSSPPKRRQQHTALDTVHSTHTALNTTLNSSSRLFPSMHASFSQSRLPPSAFTSTTDSLHEQMSRTQSNIDPNEAKSLYFAHYNGLEVG